MLSIFSKSLASRYLLLTPLVLAPLPFACAGLAACVLTEKFSYRGLLLGFAILFATLYFNREVDRIWHMGLTLSMALSALTLYFLPSKTTVKRDDSALRQSLYEAESKLLRLQRDRDEQLRTPDADQDQLIAALEAQEEAMEEITSLESVVEHLLDELKRRSVPTFPKR